MEVFINHSPVAIANKVVPRSEWPTTRLQAGTKITVIRAVCGG